MTVSETQIALKGASEKDKKNALNEVRLLSSVSCQHIIRFQCAFFETTSEDLYVVMEYACNSGNYSEKGDLSAKIEEYIGRGQMIPESEIWTILEHIAKGLSSLHKKNILHRDLKAANVFETAAGVFKIADLNVSKLLTSEHELAETQIGTPFYASPEVWENSKYDNKTDIWSLGVIAY